MDNRSTKVAARRGAARVWLARLLALGLLGTWGAPGAGAGATGPSAASVTGTISAWGNDEQGQLGNDAPVADKDTPVAVAGLTGGVAVSAGCAHSLALRNDGTAWAWGDDVLGQLGDDAAKADKHTPVPVSGLTNVVAVSAGCLHSLALKADGTVWAWGSDTYGQLGDNAALAPKFTPVQVTGLTDVIAIAAGYSHSLALLADGTVRAWGSDSDGQLGDDAVLANKPTPVPVAGLTGVNALAAGGFHSLALKRLTAGQDTIWAWGDDFAGQLGDNDELANMPTPVQVAGLTSVPTIASIAAGGAHSMMLAADGTAWVWGNSSFGQLGIGHTLPQHVPVQLTVLTGIAAIAAGGDHSLALTADIATLDLTVSGSGQVQLSPPGTVSGGGTFRYVQGSVAILTARPAAGQRFVGWTVDGANTGWGSPLAQTMGTGHSIQAIFAPTKVFPDVPSDRPDATAITELASRGTIRGYGDGSYGPDQGVQRAQMAALIARAMPAGPGTPPTALTPPACLAGGTWDCEDWGNTFSDRNGLDANLWRNVGALQHYQVAFGYDGAACAAKGVASPCYAPTAPVSYVETVVFITRAMITKGYWVLQPSAPQPYAGVPDVFGPTVATYQFYTAGAGGIPAPPSDWNAGATRGWFARALWQALNTYWGTDGTLPDGRPAGGNAP